MAPCVALALCGSSQAKACCCAKAESCCCREVGRRDTAPAPAAPVANSPLDQPAEAPVATNVGLAALPTAVALVPGADASAQAPVPIHVTNCTFRC